MWQLYCIGIFTNSALWVKKQQKKWPKSPYSRWWRWGKGRKKRSREFFFFTPPLEKKKKNQPTSSNLHWSYYPHRSRDFVSPVCGIFYFMILKTIFTKVELTIKLWYSLHNRQKCCICCISCCWWFYLGRI